MFLWRVHVFDYGQRFKNSPYHSMSETRGKRFSLIDCQVYSKHLESLGAVNIDRDLFLKYLEAGLSHETLRGNWKFFNEQKQVRNN